MHTVAVLRSRRRRPSSVNEEGEPARSDSLSDNYSKHVRFLPFRGEGKGACTLLTFPRRREYSSRTSCSRSVTRGLEARRRGFEGLSVVVLSGGVLVISESSILRIERVRRDELNRCK